MDGRPSRRNKSLFSNFYGAVDTALDLSELFYFRCKGMIPWLSKRHIEVSEFLIYWQTECFAIIVE